MIENKVKLVIWDLDNTFWSGTLAEGGVAPIGRNIDLVKALARRGIMHSICSKNDADAARRELAAMSIDDYFVFPRIGFDPKGQSIAKLIEEIALRPENVLFIDDNPFNLEEAKYYNPGIMTADPTDALDNLLAHPNLAGSPDPDLARLKQYKLLEHKAEERKATTVSNEEFLRNSQIKISLDYDIERNLDRILELINRSNQLNYTKIRIETPGDTATFREMLGQYSFHAGCVRARDLYGDYGLIGFFLLRRRSGGKKLIHFVFSCRTMHMGIEQYIYEKLGRPEIEIATPVSYGLEPHDKVDWIQEVDGKDTSTSSPTSGELVLVGGCELLQLASYCSSNRTEFVNTMKNGISVRFDDPGFILADRAAIFNADSLRSIPIWTYGDALNFDKAIASADIVIVSLASALRGRYFQTRNGVKFRLPTGSCRKICRVDPHWFDNNAEELFLNDSERLNLIIESIRKVREKSPRARIFVLGVYLLREKGSGGPEKRAYNRCCREICEADPERLDYVDMNRIVSAEYLLKKSHFDRRGYLALARHILERAAIAHETANVRAGATRAGGG